MVRVRAAAAEGTGAFKGNPAMDIDDKTCRKRQVLGVSESAEKLKSSLP
jgi:hypothetical protein